jgi:hypothetical protein
MIAVLNPMIDWSAEGGIFIGSVEEPRVLRSLTDIDRYG